MKKNFSINFLLLFVLCFVANAQQATYEQHVKQYISQYKDVAVEEMKRVGIPASITLGQGIIETDAGKSPLATEANNHFGIKCHDGWGGETYTYDDDKKGECFRKYKDAYESFKDHSDFLKTRDRYAVLFKLDATDYKAWAKGLKSCGYATNPKYAEILINTIEANNLQQYDSMGLKGYFAKDKTPKDSTAVATTAIVQQSQDPQTEAIVSDIHNPGGSVFLINDVKVIELKPGETLQQVSKTYDIGMKRLLKYNDLGEKAVVKAGDKIYLQPKRHNGGEAYHTVEAGETMYSISQQQGIQLTHLYIKNKMEVGAQPAIGQIIFLRSDRDYAPKLAEPVMVTANVPPVNTTPVKTIDTNDNKYYTVQKGDTLYSISKKYNLSVDDLKSRNNLSGNDISVGDKLQVH